MDVGKNGTLYILGNGFDVCHNLDTSPEVFLKILGRKQIYNELDSARDVFERYSVLWGDYESCLADIDLEEIVEEQTIAPDYLSDHEYERDGGIHNMEQYTESLHWAVQESLEEMIDAANSKLTAEERVLINFLKDGDAVLSFNYTSTLERLYSVPNSVPICHIHGFREKEEPLLLGYRDGISKSDFNKEYLDIDTVNELQKSMECIEKDESLPMEEREKQLDYLQFCVDELTRDWDFYIAKQRDAVFQFYNSLKKELQIEKLKQFLRDRKGLSRIVVMGHSMSSVDKEYMEIVENMIHPIGWKISQYEKSPSDFDVEGYSFAKKVKFYDLKEEYSK